MYQIYQNELRRSFWRVRFSVLPNEVGYLYRRNRLEQKLDEGIYDYFDYQNVLQIDYFAKDKSNSECRESRGS